MIYVFLATGFEDIESIAPVDIMRRAGLKVQTVSITGERIVASAHGVGIAADIMLPDVDFRKAEMLVLPGGLPGATNLNDHEGVRDAMLKQYNAGKKVGAICAAPLVLGGLGILNGKRATCYPGFEDQMTGAEYTAEVFTIDGNVITGCGPAATLPYSYAILEMLGYGEQAAALREGMMFNKLLNL